MRKTLAGTKQTNLHDLFQKKRKTAILLFVTFAYYSDCLFIFVFQIRIQIRRIRKFLAHPDPLVRGMDPNPDPSIHRAKIVRKSLFILFCDFFMTSGLKE